MIECFCVKIYIRNSYFNEIDDFSRDLTAQHCSDPVFLLNFSREVPLMKSCSSLNEEARPAALLYFSI